MVHSGGIDFANSILLRPCGLHPRPSQVLLSQVLHQLPRPQRLRLHLLKLPRRLLNRQLVSGVDVPYFGYKQKGLGRIMACLAAFCGRKSFWGVWEAIFFCFAQVFRLPNAPGLRLSYHPGGEHRCHFNYEHLGTLLFFSLTIQKIDPSRQIICSTNHTNSCVALPVSGFTLLFCGLESGLFTRLEKKLANHSNKLICLAVICVCACEVSEFLLSNA